MSGIIGGVGNVLHLLGVPAFHRMPTFRRSAGGYAVIVLIAAGMPRLASAGVDLRWLNTLIAFFRNFFCIWKDLYPLFLTRIWPALFRLTPLTWLVSAHQYLGGSMLNIYLGFTGWSHARDEKARLASWQTLARKTSRDGFQSVIKDSAEQGEKLGAKGSARQAAKGIASVEGRRIVEDEIDRALNAEGVSELQSGCRFFIGAGFIYLSFYGLKLTGFTALCRGISVMLTGLAISLISADHGVKETLRDARDTLQAVSYLLGELPADAPPPSLVAPETSQGIDKSARRLRLLGALVAPKDPDLAAARSARPWDLNWGVRRAQRIAAVPKPTGESGRAAVAAAERRGDDVSAAAAKAALEKAPEPLKAGAQCWVLPDEGASSSAGASSTKRRAMLVIDNENGTWNVVYNVRDPDRVWNDDEDEEEDVAVDRLVMAKKQELQPSRPKPADPTTLEPEGLHSVDPTEYEEQEEFGKEVERVMLALLEAEGERSVTTLTALRDVLEFFQRGGAPGGGTRAAVRCPCPRPALVFAQQS